MSLSDLFTKRTIPPKTAIIVEKEGDVELHSFTGQTVTKFDLMSIATKESGQPGAAAKGDDTAISGGVIVDAIPFDPDTAPHILTIMGTKKAGQKPDPEWAIQMFPGHE